MIGENSYWLNKKLFPKKKYMNFSVKNKPIRIFIKKASITRKLATKLVLFIFSKYCQSGKNFTIKATENKIKITNKNQILSDGSKNKLSTILSKFNSPKVKKIAKKQIKIRIDDTELKQKFLKEILSNLLL